VPKILTNKEFLSKIERYILPVILILVGLTAFGLGRLSVAQVQPAGYTAAANCPGL